ncbi:hypothetical protein RugamoR64_10420 [Duganella rhizosphaerae]
MRLLLLWFVLAITNIASANTPYETRGVVLLQPESVLNERIQTNSLASYIRSVNAAATDVFASQTHGPAAGFLVLAIRPGNQSAAWLDVSPALPPDLASDLVARLRALPVPEVQLGPVVFAVRAVLWGGEPLDQNLPEPEEWRRAAHEAGQPLEIGELVGRIWPR